MKNNSFLQNCFQKIVLIIPLIICSSAFSQDIEFESIFTNLNPANISTGILIDKTYITSAVTLLNGTSDSIVTTESEWFNIYSEIIDAHVITPTFPTVDSINNSIYSIYGQLKVPICISNIKYNRIKQNALTDGLLDSINNQLYDVTNPPESPYSVERYFSAICFFNDFESDSITFTIDNSLYISNSTETIQSIDLDFGSGNSFSGLNINSDVSLPLSSLNSTATITLHLSGNSTLISKFKIIETPYFKSLQISTSDDIIDTIETTYNGKKFRCNCGVWFGCETNSLNDIKKPIIVLEGWDPLNEKTIDGIYNQINKEIGDGVQFNESLLNNGFDIITMSYGSGGGEIQGNAMLVVELIEYLRNLMEANNNYNEFIIMGISMGGLVARYALAYMEHNNIPHYTKLFLSIDSPQQGAYMPHAVRAFAKGYMDYGFLIDIITFAKDNYVIGNDEVKDLRTALYCPASQQMSVYAYPQTTYTPSPSLLRTQLLNEFSGFGNDGYPSNVDKMVAFSFGSGNGTGQTGLSPGTTRFSYNASFENLDNLEIFAKALPNSSTLQVAKVALTKKIKNPLSEWPVFKWFVEKYITINAVLLHSEVTNTLPYESAPGSYQNVTSELLGKINEKLQDYGVSMSLTGPNDCFIPTISALHLKNKPLYYNILEDLTGNNNYYEVNNKSITPFDAIYVQEINRIHDNEGVTEEMMQQIIDLIIQDDLVLSAKSIDNNSIQFEAANTIVLDNIEVKNQSVLNLRAGQSITLDSNISIEAGSELNTTLQTYCE